MSGYCKKCGNQHCICDEIAKNEGLISNEIERSFQVLELYGVPRERAHSVHNWIEVLVTRMKRENEAISGNAESIRALLKEAVKLIQQHHDAHPIYDPTGLQEEDAKFLARAKEVLK